MREFEARHPRVRTALVIDNSDGIVERLAAHEVDLAVVGLPPASEEFVSKPIYEDRIVMFASARHPLADVCTTAARKPSSRP